jgi:hypothetical protein
MIYSAYSCLQLVTLLGSVAVILSSCESISLRTHYRNQGLFSWRVHRMRSARTVHSPFIRVYDQLFTYPAVIYLLAFRVTCCLAIPFAITHRYALASICGAIAFMSILLSIRGTDGKNGADEMSKITFLSLMIAFFSSHPLLWKIEIFFLAGQLCIAYVTSGYLRIQEESWRDGSALLLVFRQRTYGNKLCWTIGRRCPRAVQAASMSVLLFECTFPFTLFLPRYMLMPILAFGIAFHVANAIIIGLNTFLWAFVALYPAFLWAAMYTQQGLRC